MKPVLFALTCLPAFLAPLMARAEPPISTAEVHQACEFVANIQRYDIPWYIIKRGFFDIDGDGQPETISQAENTGTMGGDSLNVTSAKPSALPSYKSGAENWPTDENPPDSIRWTHGEGILPFQSKFLFLHAWEEDLLYPTALSYENYYLCEFGTKVSTEVYTLEPEKISAQVCESIFADNPPPEFKEIPFSESDPRLAEFPAKSRNAGDDAAGIMAIADIDYLNNGAPEPVIKYGISTGGGRGCERIFYGALPNRKMENALLEKMQDASFKTCTGERTHWWLYNGRTYFENKNNGEDIGSKNQEFQYLSYIKDGEIHEACTTSFTPKTEVGKYFPPFDK